MMAPYNIPTIVIDLDNTVIDTAVRKQSLLRKHFNIEVDIHNIRSDYHLANCLGNENTLSNRFFALLDTSEEIMLNPAPAIQGACETILWLEENNFNIIFLTARPEECREVTLQELTNANIKCPSERLIMRDCKNGGAFTDDLSYSHKKMAYAALASKYQIIAGIGDRPEDALAAQDVNVPAILIKTTITNEEIVKLRDRQTTGIEITNSWPEVAASFQQIRSGIVQMEKLRELFIAQYAQWLYDVDEKIKAVIAISTVLSAIVGNQLLKITSLTFDNILLLATLFLSVLSVIYCIRGLTSRRTSGHFATTELKGHIKQIISVLFGGPRKWLYRKGDAIDTYNRLSNLSSHEKATAHLSFFFTEYGTYNPQALLNMRMLELRAAVYSKSYAERIASHLLMVAVLLLLMWIVTFTISQPIELH